MAIPQSALGSSKVAMPLFFGDNGVAANTTTGTIWIQKVYGGTLNVWDYTMPAKGSVIGVTARLPNAPTAGTLTLMPRINGSLTPFEVAKHVNSTDIQAFYSNQEARRANSIFSAGDRVGLSFTTTSDWAAVQAIECIVMVILEEVAY